MYKNIVIIGLGYVGLPIAAMLASRKHCVTGVDIDEAVVERINGRALDFLEPQLDILVRAAVSQGYLHATRHIEPADVYLIAVPTPLDDDKVPDISHIESASRAIAPLLKPGDLVILESTSPVGTTDRLASWLASRRPDLLFPSPDKPDADVRIAYCPERVLPGHVVQELVENDRIIGGITPACSRAATDFYRLFVSGRCIATSPRTAELCKLTENSFRDLNIAFANELSMVCDDLDVDVRELIRLANHHPRVNILQPGPGVGGHCVAVDPWFIVHAAPQRAQLIRTARSVNDSKPAWVVSKVEKAFAAFDHPTRRLRIACLGLSFKADIDDLRESPALAITQALAMRFRGQVRAVEPHITAVPPELLSLDVQLVTLADALAADVLVLLVDHSAFAEQLPALASHPCLIDTRGLLAPMNTRS